MRLEGELDLESAPALSRELDRLLAGDHRRVVIDLDELESQTVRASSVCSLRPRFPEAMAMR